MSFDPVEYQILLTKLRKIITDNSVNPSDYYNKTYIDANIYSKEYIDTNFDAAKPPKVLSSSSSLAERTLGQTDYGRLIVCQGSNNFSIVINRTGLVTGWSVEISNKSNITVSLEPNAGNIEGASSYNASSYAQGSIHFDGTNFYTFNLSPIVNQVGGKNLLLNGNFNVNQRSYPSGSPTSLNNQYTFDMWRIPSSGQNLVYTPFQNGNQITSPAGGVEQVIQSQNVQGGQYVLNWIGTATATVNGTPRTKGEVFSLSSNIDVTIRLIGGTAAQVQFEKGLLPTLFESKSYEEELDSCMAYRESGIFDYGLVALNAGQLISLGLNFKKTKVRPPTSINKSFIYSAGVSDYQTIITASNFVQIFETQNGGQIGARYNWTVDVSP